MKNNFPKIPFFISILFFCLFFLAFLYLYKEINNNDEESQSAESEWQIEAQRRDEIRALENSVKIIEEERARLETHFARSSDVVPFLDTIEGLASRVGAKAEITSVDIMKDHTGLMVEMKTSGTFGGLYKFLTLLENSPYELEFISMDLNRGVVSSGSGTDIKSLKWDATFRIKLLSFIE